jgi:hypothetical protein
MLSIGLQQPPARTMDKTTPAPPTTTILLNNNDNNNNNNNNNKYERESGRAHLVVMIGVRRSSFQIRAVLHDPTLSPSPFLPRPDTRAHTHAHHPSLHSASSLLASLPPLPLSMLLSLSLPSIALSLSLPLVSSSLPLSLSPLPPLYLLLSRCVPLPQPLGRCRASDCAARAQPDNRPGLQFAPAPAHRKSLAHRPSRPTPHLLTGPWVRASDPISRCRISDRMTGIGSDVGSGHRIGSCRAGTTAPTHSSSSSPILPYTFHQLDPTMSP